MDLNKTIVSQLPLWKERFGEVFLLPLRDGVLVYRCITYREAFDYNERYKHDPLLATDLLVKAVVLYSDVDVLDLPNKAVDTIVDKVLSSSSLDSLEYLNSQIEKNRKFAKGTVGYCAAWLMHAFNIPYQVIRDMPIPILARYMALAEVVTGKTFTFKEEGKGSPKNKFFNPDQIEASRQQLFEKQKQAALRNRRHAVPMEQRIKEARNQAYANPALAEVQKQVQSPKPSKVDIAREFADLYAFDPSITGDE